MRVVVRQVGQVQGLRDHSACQGMVILENLVGEGYGSDHLLQHQDLAE